MHPGLKYIQLLPAFCLQFLCICNALQFNYKDFTDISNITLLGSSVQSGSTVILLPDPDHPTASTEYNYTFSWMVYTELIPLILSTGNPLTRQKSAQSVNTSFNFQLNTPGNQTNCSSGMTFFFYDNLSEFAIDRAISGMYFGSADGTAVSPVTNPFFAVEFDTIISDSTNDPSSSHIGIDISSINSVKTVDTSKGSYYPKFYLYNNYTFKTWIAYNSSSQLIKVWMANINKSSTDYHNYLNPPGDDVLAPIMLYQYDLTAVFMNTHNNLRVGFSGATRSDKSMLGVHIYSWYFSISNSSTASSYETAMRQKDKKISLDKRYIEIIIPFAIIAFFSVALAVAMAFYCKRITASRYYQGKNLNESAALILPRYSYQELELSTNGFDKEMLIGERGFSRVYKGKLEDGTILAIKRLKNGIRKEAEFSAEMRIIHAIRHRNLLQLQGWSYDRGEALLVYTFLSKGSLNRYIYGERRGTLDSATRLRILSGVAAGLEYLHFGLGNCVLHRDVKAANVLLTDKLEPVLGDFGLARLIKHNQTVSATVAGTFGYVAPEVVLTRRVTDKADVYSFGVLILEVSCGCEAFHKGPLKPDQRQYLVEHVLQLQQKDCISEAVDISIVQLESSMSKSSSNANNITNVKEQWKRILHLGLVCCNQNPECRPDIKYVNQEIHNIIHGTTLSFPTPIVNTYPQSHNIEMPTLSIYAPTTDPSQTTSPASAFTTDFSSLVAPR